MLTKLLENWREKYSRKNCHTDIQRTIQEHGIIKRMKIDDQRYWWDEMGEMWQIYFLQFLFFISLVPNKYIPTSSPVQNKDTFKILKHLYTFLKSKWGVSKTTQVVLWLIVWSLNWIEMVIKNHITVSCIYRGISKNLV